MTSKSKDSDHSLPAKVELDDGFEDTAANSDRFNTRLGYAPDTSKWSAKNGSIIPDRPLLVWGTNDVIVRFATDDGKPEFIFKEKGKSLPSLEKLNGSVPKDQYPIGLNGEAEKPYKYNWIVYLTDEQTAERFSYMNSTYGTFLAVGALRTRVQDMRHLRGEDVYPFVTLGSAPMRTKFGMKTRPDFQIQSWRKLGPATPAIAGPDTPQLTSSIGVEVEEPSLSEVMDDEIKY
jgi:hypothetical protein